MNNKTKLLILLAPVLGLVTGCGPRGGRGGYDGPIQTITIDGGGDISNFNTTASMTKSEANPYPYNTLETLCKQWEESHPGFKVKVNKTSAGGDRATVLSQLKSKTAPDILYQNGTVINSDLGLDYYVDLTPYLEKEDPYLKDNAKWKTVYEESDLGSLQAADGEIYYVCLEKIPVCFMYNKTLLAQAGITNPEDIDTFSKLVESMSTLKNYYRTASKDATYGVYSGEYTWYQLALECNYFSDLLENTDVLRKNGIVDTEEMCRAFEKNIWEPTKGITNLTGDAGNDYESNRYYEYIKLIERLDQNKEDATYSARANFTAGKLGFLEVTGQHLRTLSAAIDSSDEKFEWGTIPFPNLTSADVKDSSYATKGVVRGSAGLATAWFVTNTAIEAGQSKVDACVDLLMYLTAPEQNNRLIGDLKGGIPLNLSESYELSPYLKPLVNVYDADKKEMAKGNMVAWQSFNSWNALGNSYNTAFIRAMQDLDINIKNKEQGKSAEQCARELSISIKNTVKAYIMEYGYDTTEW